MATVLENSSNGVKDESRESSEKTILIFSI